MLWRIRKAWLLWRWRRRTGLSSEAFFRAHQFVSEVATMTPREQVLMAAFYARYWTAAGAPEEEAAAGAQALLSAVRKHNGGTEEAP